jgi:hypothetical protein
MLDLGRPESVRAAWIIKELRHHSAIMPPCTKARWCTEAYTLMPMPASWATSSPMWVEAANILNRPSSQAWMKSRLLLAPKAAGRVAIVA